jgi:hypothetical protein
MKFVNLTRHAVDVIAVDGYRLSVPPSGTELRVDYAPIRSRYVMLDGHAVEIVTDGVVRGIQNLPERVDGTLYIASYAAMEYCSKVLLRDDIICPATAHKDDPIKDGNGFVTAVRKFRMTPRAQ